MKAFIRTESGVELKNIDIPKPTENEILIRVRASTLNRADLSLVDGKAHGSHGGPGTVLGLEWAGDVVKVGASVNTFKPGDRVMCSGLGGFAEYAVTDWRRAFPIPNEQMSYEAASCLPVALRTAHTALTELGQLQKGQSVLVLGASSGVGIMTMQVAKALGAGRVIGTSTKQERRKDLHAFGADFAINSKDQDWSQQILKLTENQGVDLSIDFLAGPLFNDNMRAVKIGGRIVNVGRMAGEFAEVDFDLHSMRRIQYLGMTFRTRSVENVGEIAGRVRNDLWEALQANQLGLPIDIRLPLERAKEAFELMRGNAHFGKIVLTQDA